MKSVIAPGKAILAGEYAVLHGGPAIAVAVDRCARAWLSPGQGTAPSPFVVAALEKAARELKAQHLLASGQLGVDSSALYQGTKKTGLGSSAAVTVATLGAAFVAEGRSLEDKRKIFTLADDAHAVAQGTRGSGIDVAVAVYGGAIKFQRKNGEVEIEPVELPDGIHLTFVFTGQSASTPQLIAKVKALAERQPAHHEAAIGRLLLQAHAFCAAIAHGEARELIEAADAYREAMQHLGEAAEAEIVTREHTQLAMLARRHGGTAKPSGAGGGDLGVAFTLGADATQALRKESRAAGMNVLSLGAPAPGLRMMENAE
jgi:phosphomevalonate kinase